MTKYALLIFHEEQPNERQAPDALGPWIEFSRQAVALGVEQAGEPLDSSTTAKVVSVRGGKPFVTDGPFADTKEQLCGYYLFDCPDRESALKLASMIPIAKVGHIEVRPVVDFSGPAD